MRNTLQTPDPEYRLKAEWATRAKRPHNNAVENLVIFCSLVLTVVFLGKQNEITAMASMIFFICKTDS
ncbi:MAG: MAPEG family protein [Proteobacteria bacterium]|nr:MAPEG family protein [Pseudomonadota bacterium]